MSISVFDPVEVGCVLSLAGPPGGGGHIHDRSQYGRQGAITGAVWNRLGGLWCLGFDGVDDSVEVPGFSDVPSANAFTVAAWVQMLRLNVGEQDFISTQNSNLNGWSFYNQSDSATLSCTAKRVGGGFVTRNFTTAATVGQWYHLVMTYDATAMKAYLDGRYSDQASTGAALDASAMPLQLGRFGSVATGFSQCRIALVRIYNRVFTPLEVQGVFHREKSSFGVW